MGEEGPSPSFPHPGAPGPSCQAFSSHLRSRDLGHPGFRFFHSVLDPWLRSRHSCYWKSCGDPSPHLKWESLAGAQGPLLTLSLEGLAAGTERPYLIWMVACRRGRGDRETPGNCGFPMSSQCTLRAWEAQALVQVVAGGFGSGPEVT